VGLQETYLTGWSGLEMGEIAQNEQVSCRTAPVGTVGIARRGDEQPLLDRHGRLPQQRMLIRAWRCQYPVDYSSRFLLSSFIHMPLHGEQEMAYFHRDYDNRRHLRYTRIVGKSLSTECNQSAAMMPRFIGKD
jgi:hypothetical protein